MQQRKTAGAPMILIAHDDEGVRESLCRFMELEGCRTTGVGNGEAALEILDALKPDLVVIKSELPRMSACETCRRVRSVIPVVPIIMLVDSAAFTADAIAAGATDVILSFQNLELLGERARCLIRVFDQMHELLATQTRLKQALRLARLGNWEWDPRGDSLWLSEEVCSIFHLEKRDTLLSYENFLATVYAPDRQLVDENLKAAVQKRSATDMAFRIKRPNGSLGTVTLHGEPGDCPEQGGYPRLCGILQDVTGTGRAENIF